VEQGNPTAGPLLFYKVSSVAPDIAMQTKYTIINYFGKLSILL